MILVDGTIVPSTDLLSVWARRSLVACSLEEMNSKDIDGK
jgi:hypothetical protein